MLILLDPALEIERLEIVLKLLQQNLFGWRVHANSENDLVLPDAERLHLRHRCDRLFAYEL